MVTYLHILSLAAIYKKSKREKGMLNYTKMGISMFAFSTIRKESRGIALTH